MGTLNELTQALKKIKQDIGEALYISHYGENGDLSGLSDYSEHHTPDEWQKLEMYHSIISKLDDIAADLAYLEAPIKYTSRLHLNESARYEDERGNYYTSGSCIEFSRADEKYNSYTNQFESVKIWTCSRIESKDGKYYIVGYPEVSLDGLETRIRG